MVRRLGETVRHNTHWCFANRLPRMRKNRRRAAFDWIGRYRLLHLRPPDPSAIEAMERKADRSSLQERASIARSDCSRGESFRSVFCSEEGLQDIESRDQYDELLFKRIRRPKPEKSFYNSANTFSIWRNKIR